MAFWERGPRQPASAEQPQPAERPDNNRPELLATNLELLGLQTGNKLHFIDVGREIKPGQADLKEALKAGLSEADLRIVRFLQQACRQYLAAPTFTDEFHQDHARRRQWEQQHLNVSGPELSYYKTNRLGTNFNDSVIGLLRLIIKTSDHSQLKEVLGPLMEKIPSEFIDRTESGNLVYDHLSDEQKIEVSLKVVTLAQQILDKLEAPAVS